MRRAGAWGCRSIQAPPFSSTKQTVFLPRVDSVCDFWLYHLKDFKSDAADGWHRCRSPRARSARRDRHSDKAGALAEVAPEKAPSATHRRRRPTRGGPADTRRHRAIPHGRRESRHPSFCHGPPHPFTCGSQIRAKPRRRSFRTAQKASARRSAKDGCLCVAPRTLGVWLPVNPAELGILEALECRIVGDFARQASRWLLWRARC